jgi:hypothetical protein
MAGCGSLVGTDYRGEVLLELEGTVLSDGTLPLEGDVGVTLLWSLDIDTDAQQSSVVASTSFPSRYTLQLFHPPQSGAFIDLFGQDWLEAAVGQPILYMDHDGDGRWDRGEEEVVGGAFDRAVIWIESLGDSSLGGAGWVPEREGFHLVDVERPPCLDLEPEELPVLPAEGSTDLHVGYLWNTGFDWDCDGEQDHDPNEVFEPHPCEEQLEDCQGSGEDQTLCDQWYADCLDPSSGPQTDQCAEQLDECHNSGGDPVQCQQDYELCMDPDYSPTDPDDPDQVCAGYWIEDVCWQFEQALNGDPQEQAGYLDWLLSDPILQQCMQGQCPQTVDEYLQYAP